MNIAESVFHNPDRSGELIPAVIEYEPDDGDVLITAVILKRCVKQRGDTAYCPDGSFYKVTFPEFIQLDITQFLRGSQIKALADEISSTIAADAADARTGEGWTACHEHYRSRPYATRRYAGVNKNLYDFVERRREHGSGRRR